MTNYLFQVMLQCLQRISDLSYARALVTVLLKLFQYCVKVCIVVDCVIIRYIFRCYFSLPGVPVVLSLDFITFLLVFSGACE